MRTGRSELIEEIPRALLEVAIAVAPELCSLLDELQLRSSMVVPMVLQGEAIGAITFVMAESGRRYSPLDMQLAEELAARAAIAIGNARLYWAEQRALSASEQARRRTEVLVELGDRLTSSPELPTAPAALRLVPRGRTRRRGHGVPRRSRWGRHLDDRRP
ncbi:MAG: GAF domain-containing protein [Actinomycetota bacterium]